MSAKRFDLIASGVLLSVFFAYIAAGNLARFSSVPLISGSFPLTEILIYSASITFLAIERKKIPIPFIFALALIALAFFTGFVQYGFAKAPAMYTVRLVCMLVSAYAVGRALLLSFARDWARALRLFALAYAIMLGIGFLIYFSIPNSIIFWVWLRDHGIVFHGDPHQKRFYSVMFDPNFYSSIAIFAMILQYVLFRKTGHIAWLGLSVLMAISVALSKSRSGFAALVLVCAIWAVPTLLRAIFSRSKVRYGSLGLLGLVAAGGIGVCIKKPDIIMPVINRIVSSGGGDRSTAHRFESFGRGFDLIALHPFGVGYNYYTALFPGELTSLDSSILMLFVTFGLPLAGLLLLCATGFCVLFGKRTLKTESGDPAFKLLCVLLLVYVGVSVLWTSNFNNLLVYQFWLVPVCSCMYYLFLTRKP